MSSPCSITISSSFANGSTLTTSGSSILVSSSFFVTFLTSAFLNTVFAFFMRLAATAVLAPVAAGLAAAGFAATVVLDFVRGALAGYFLGGIIY